MIVMKFGGSSVADADRIQHITKIIKTQLDEKPAVVLSAMGDTTDHLLEAADKALYEGAVETSEIKKLHNDTIKELNLQQSAGDEVNALLNELTRLLSGIALIKELTPKTRDFLVSFGERLSVRIAAACLQAAGINAKAVDAWDCGFLTNSSYGSAELLKESWELIPKKILPLIKSGVLPVITGFIGKDERGCVTTLGRGGSDLSATMIAAACHAKEVQVWKDVDGILTADPRIVEKARPVKSVTYEEAAELAYYGAQVLHPRAMQPCMKTGTPVLVKNSYNINAPGTRIENVVKTDNNNRKLPPVHAITTRRGVTLIDIVSTRMLGQYGFLNEVFLVFAKNNVSIDMVATSEVSVSLTLDSSNELEDVKNELGKFADVEVKTGKAIVSIIGNVSRSSEILARTFRICQGIGVTVQMVSHGASKVNISFIVNDDEAVEVVNSLHVEFF